MEFKTHIDFPGYLFYEDGSVYSDTKHVGYRKRKMKVNQAGYIIFEAMIKRKRIQRLLHRIMADCFISLPDKKGIVIHINGNKLDNRASNLKRLSYSEKNSHNYQKRKNKTVI